MNLSLILFEKSRVLLLSTAPATDMSDAVSAYQSASASLSAGPGGHSASSASSAQPAPAPWKPICFVTGNPNKLKEVSQILDGKVEFIHMALDLPELQGTPEEVAAAKAKAAQKLYGGPVLVEDTSLCFNALGGLPGVYIKHFLAHCGHEGLNQMLDGFTDRSAYAQCIFAYCDGGAHAEPLLFVGRCPGHIVRPRGPTTFGWDPVFQPDESNGLTYAEMPSAEKNKISHRGRALAKLCAWIAENLVSGGAKQ